MSGRTTLLEYVFHGKQIVPQKRAVKKQQKFFHNPSVSFADSIPQFAMVVPLRSQVRLRLSLAHWAYYGLFPPLAAAFVRPLCEKGAFWLVAQPYEVALPKSLLFPEGKREVARRKP